MAFPTPKYSHLKSDDFDKLYEPAEDTFLMLDALEKDCDLIQGRKPALCMEIGPGSGIVITFLATIIGPASFYIASDINHDASVSAMNCGKENNVDINSLTDNLITSLRSRLKEKVDILVFNPPYVVTPHEEVGGTSLSASWAGGENGREVIDKFLPLVADILSDRGLLYLLLIEQNKPDEVMNILEQYGLKSTVVLRRRAGPEHLFVLRSSHL